MGAREMPAGLVQARAILGIESDPFGAWWDRATEGERRVLLMAARYHRPGMLTRQWSGLDDQDRLTIKTKARDFSRWLSGVVTAMDRPGVVL